jgi:predicted DCC family thiol-disulfide oxidoreductase YuxK
MRLLPRAPRDALYRALARRRYRWFGTTACHVPTPAQRARFLD